MELARTLRELGRHRLLLALGVLVAGAAALFGVSGNSLKHSGASTQVLVDAKQSLLGSVNQPFEPLASRAQVYANFMASPAFLDRIGKRVGIEGDQIFAAGPVNANEPRVEQEPTALKRNLQLTGESKPYRINYESQLNLPTIGIYAQAPTTSQAEALVNAAASSLQSYVANIESVAQIPPHSQIVIRQLGPATGSVSDGGIGKKIALLVFVLVFAVWCLLVLLGTRFRETWRSSAHGTPGASGQDGVRPKPGREHLDQVESSAANVEVDSPEDEPVPVPARVIRW